MRILLTLVFLCGAMILGVFKQGVGACQWGNFFVLAFAVREKVSPLPPNAAVLRLSSTVFFFTVCGGEMSI